MIKTLTKLKKIIGKKDIPFWIAPVLSSASLLLFCLTVVISKVTVISVEAKFGLLTVVPSFWWLSFFLALIGLVFSIFQRKELIFCYALLVLILVLWNLPTFIEPYPRTWDAYWHFESGVRIAQEESIPPTSSNFYYQWPGSFLVLAFFLKIGGITDPDTLLCIVRFFPLFSSFLFTMLMYMFFRKLLDIKVARASISILLLINVYLQFHFSPQAYALILLPLLLYALIYSEKQWRIVQLLLFLGILVSHLPTTLFVVSILIFAWLSYKLLSLKGRMALDAKWVAVILIFFLFYLLIFWNSTFSSVISTFSSDILPNKGSSNGMPILVILERYIGGPFAMAKTMRFICLAVTTLAMFLIGFKLYKKKDQNLSFIGPILLFSIIFIIMTMILPGMSNMIDRGPMFLYIGFAAAFGIWTYKQSQEANHVKNKGDLGEKITDLYEQKDISETKITHKFKAVSILKPIIIGILIILIMGNSVTLYYQEGLKIFSQTDFAGLDFIYSGEHIEPSNAGIYMKGNAPARLIYTEQHITAAYYYYTYSSLIQRNFTTDFYVVFNHPAKMGYYYSEKLDQYFDAREEFENSALWEKIYANGDYEIYKRSTLY